MPHNRDSNLSLTTASVAVISVSLLQVFLIPFPLLSAFWRKHPQCNMKHSKLKSDPWLKSYRRAGLPTLPTINHKLSRQSHGWLNTETHTGIVSSQSLFPLPSVTGYLSDIEGSIIILKTMSGKACKYRTESVTRGSTRRLYYWSPTPHVSTAQGTPDSDHDTHVPAHIVFFFLSFPTCEAYRPANRHPDPSPSSANKGSDNGERPPSRIPHTNARSPPYQLTRSLFRI